MGLKPKNIKIFTMCLLVITGMFFWISTNLNAEYLSFLVSSAEGTSATSKSLLTTDAFAGETNWSDPTLEVLAEDKTSFFKNKIKPIFDSRCVACHSCNNAPCQLKLSSPEGMERGATQQRFYRISIREKSKAVQPTRLFIDAHGSEWRSPKMGQFFPVLSHLEKPQDNFENSVLMQLVSLRKSVPLIQISETSESSNQCESLNSVKNSRDSLPSLPSWSLPENVEAWLKSQGIPWGNKHKGLWESQLGMPYGFPPLSNEDFNLLAQWIGSGASFPSEAETLPIEHLKEIEKWENFFNIPTPKGKIVSRYIYEHLFLAHIYLGDLYEGEKGERPLFYRLVRTTQTKKEHKVVTREIATRLPYDDPGSDFVYRLKRVTSTIVSKSHVPYKLDLQKMERWKELFFDSTWNLTHEDLPPYKSSSLKGSQKISSNPFKSFMKIPAKARYYFLLDSAQFFVKTFIRGPVCYGPEALNVIQDHSWVFFMDPESDISVTNPDFFQFKSSQEEHNFYYGKTISDLLALPAEEAGATTAKRAANVFIDLYVRRLKEYTKLRDILYAQGRPRLGLQDIWSGDSNNEGQYGFGATQNSNRSLTVFRHFDSATVTKGLLGDIPKTGWLLDYPIFERIYYDLVASFDVFGPVIDSLSTRVYKDKLRVEAEDMFLSLLPDRLREETRKYWYDASTPLGRRWLHQLMDTDFTYYPKKDQKNRETLIQYTPLETKTMETLVPSLFNKLISYLQNNSQDENETDKLNCFQCDGFQASENPTEKLIQKIVSKENRNLVYTKCFPEVSFLRIKPSPGYITDAETSSSSGNQVFSIIRNRSRRNVKFIFYEENDPENDTVFFMKNYLGTYPNLFFVVEESSFSDFISELKDLPSSKEDEGQKVQTCNTEAYHKFLKKWALSRYNPQFWKHYDWFQSDFLKKNPINGGVIDLNRYDLSKWDNQTN